MSKQSIIEAIDSVIEDRQMRVGEKVLTLQNLASQYWDTIYPDLGTQTYDTLTTQEKQARWDDVLYGRALSHTNNPEKIKRVLNWPATGEMFDWLE